MVGSSGPTNRPRSDIGTRKAAAAHSAVPSQRPASRAPEPRSPATTTSTAGTKGPMTSTKGTAAAASCAPDSPLATTCGTIGVPNAP